jgi:DNA gyrase/topoisomerase IV subunit B
MFGDAPLWRHAHPALARLSLLQGDQPLRDRPPMYIWSTMPRGLTKPPT